MQKKQGVRSILVFVLLTILAALIHAYEKELSVLLLQLLGRPLDTVWVPFANTVFFVLYSLLYFGLLLRWTASVQRRLLPSQERKYVLAATVMLLLFLVLRTVKFRIADYDENFKRLSWYAYYTPLAVATALFWMTALRIRRQGRRGWFDERLLLVPAVLLAALALSNDLHHLVFRPNSEGILGPDMHTYGFGYILFWGWIAASFLAGLVCLTQARWRIRRDVTVLAPFGMFLLSAAGLTLQMLTPDRRPIFAFAECFSFCMLGIFELCIRSSMIPSNANYGAFFAEMRLPAKITDDRLQAAYQTAAPIPATAEQLKASLDAPVRLDEDTLLFGRELSPGHGFYTVDESELHRLNARLEEANELLDAENELLAAENELRAKKAKVDLRTRIYSRVAERMYPAQQRVAALLKTTRPEAEDFSCAVARVSVINAFIKRGTNLLLAAENADRLPAGELLLAFEESARYLGFCGVRASVQHVPAPDGTDMLPNETAFALYESFELVLEALLDQVSLLQIVQENDTIRLVADCDALPALPETPAGTQSACADGFWTIRIGASAKGGAL